MKYKIVAWECDRDGFPTGKERLFVSKSSREVARQIAYELNGEARGTIVYIDGKLSWACRSYDKVK